MPVEPDAEVMQRYPRRRTCPQPTQLVRALSSEAEGSGGDVGRIWQGRGRVAVPVPRALGMGLEWDRDPQRQRDLQEDGRRGG
ncbi:MAG: hypothetical protein M3338_06605, partial [Actinomycetota bacterium]|nr:hypothetical protein [Actinomycetota bacterium]